MNADASIVPIDLPTIGTVTQVSAILCMALGGPVVATDRRVLGASYADFPLA
jgi:hypothetical protein